MKKFLLLLAVAFVANCAVAQHLGKEYRLKKHE